MNTFQELSLPLALEKALREMGFNQPTPIQAQAIPVALERRDLMGCAQTGTGKTAAFGIPVLTRLLKAPQKLALILAPTRELAAQIVGVLDQLSRFAPELKSTLLIGGASMKPQIKALSRRPRLIVATPGRLVDHLNRGTVTLSQVEVLVLDEADRMLDMGFAPQLQKILRFLPKTRQTLLFSATFPPYIQKLAKQFLKDPIEVKVGANSQPVSAIHQSVIQTVPTQKNEVLVGELEKREGSILIFARTQSRTDRLARFLEHRGLPVGRIHGGRTQGQRQTAISGFREGRFRILVATDIAARGIDISHIAHVINYDLPQAAEDYVHRIGRTARAGARGEALSLLIPEDRAQWVEICRLIQRKPESSAKGVAARR